MLVVTRSRLLTICRHRHFVTSLVVTGDLPHAQLTISPSESAINNCSSTRHRSLARHMPY